MRVLKNCFLHIACMCNLNVVPVYKGLWFVYESEACRVTSILWTRFSTIQCSFTLDCVYALSCFRGSLCLYTQEIRSNRRILNEIIISMINSLTKNRQCLTMLKIMSETWHLFPVECVNGYYYFPPMLHRRI